MFKVYPIKMKPMYKERVWGGRKLAAMMPLPGRRKIGEVWFFADEGEDHSVVANGSLKGRRISEVMQKYGREMLGRDLYKKYGSRFPILLKFLDSEEKLSVQVHPDDNYAREREQSWGKTEAWYIIKAKKNARVLLGLKGSIKNQPGRETVKKWILDGTIGSKLESYTVKQGDFYYIPSGTFHAIAAGSIIFEIQQNSDITYRVYDWDRLFDGVPRKLHIADALAVFRARPSAGKVPPQKVVKNGKAQLRQLHSCEYFGAGEATLSAGTKLWVKGNSPFIITSLRGRVEVSLANGEKCPVEQYESAFIPAAAGGVLVKSKNASKLIFTEIR